MLFRVGQLVNRIERTIDRRTRKVTKHLHPSIIAGFDYSLQSMTLIVMYDIRTGEKHHVIDNENTVHIEIEEMNGV